MSSYPQQPLVPKIAPEDFFGATPKDTYRQSARETARKYRVNEDLFERLIKQESGFNPKARSPKGASGMGQFMPGTGKQYGLSSPSDFADPYKSLDASARHIRDLLDANDNDEERALAAYNAGQGRVDDGSYLRIPETRNYIKTIRGFVSDELKPKVSPDDFFAGEAQQAIPPVNDAAALVTELQTNQHVKQPLGNAEAAVGQKATLPTSKPPMQEVSIDLSDFIKEKWIPGHADIAQRVYQQMGFSDEEAEEYAKQLGKDVPSAFYSAVDPEAAAVSILERAKTNDRGLASIQGLTPEAFADKQKWLEDYRDSKIRALPAAERERMALEIAKTRPLTERERKALGFERGFGGQALVDVTTGGIGGVGSMLKGAEVLQENIPGANLLTKGMEAVGLGDYAPSNLVGGIGDQLRQVAKEGRNLKGGQDTIDDFLSVIGGAVPYVAGGFAGAPVAATMGALANAGDLYSEARAAGASEKTAGLAGLAGAPIGALSGLIGLGRTGSRVTAGKARGIIATILREMGEEGTEEGVQQVLNNLVAKGIYDPKREVFKDVGYNAMLGAFTGGTLGGGTHLASRGMQKLAGRGDVSSPVVQQQTSPQEQIINEQRASQPLPPTREVQAPVAEVAPLPTPVPAPVETQSVDEKQNQANKPEWLNSEIDRLASEADKLGVSDKIEDLAVQGLTTKQIASELGVDGDLVRGVKAKRNIPSIDEPADFQKWKDSRSQPKRGLPLPDEATKQVVKEEKTTGVKNAVVEAERAERGLSPVMKEARKAAGTTFDAGKEIVDADPNFRDKVAAWARNPKNLTDDETGAALYDRARLSEEHQTTMEQILVAREAGDTIAEATAREALNRIEKQRDDNDRAVTHSGTQNARALAFRRFLVKEDYSLANLVQRAKVAHQGREISEKTRVKLEKHAKELADLQEQFDKRGERIAELEAERAVKNIEKTVSRQSRRAKRAVTKQQLDAEYADLSKQFFAAASKLSANPLADPTLYSLIGKIAQNRVKAGFNTASGLVDEVYNTIKDQVKGITKRDVRDAISGYGMPRKTKNQIDSELTKVKRELREMSKNEDKDPVTEAAKAEASKRKAQKTRLENRLQELDTLLATKAYYKNPDGSPSMTKPRNPLALDAGALKTQREITMKKALIEQDFRKMKRESILDTATHTRQSAMLANVVGITQDIVNTTAHNVTATLNMVPETILDIAQSQRTGQRTSALRGTKPFRSVGAGLKKAATESKLVFKSGVSERMAQEQEIPHESYTGEGKAAQIFDASRNYVSRIRTIADLPNWEVALEIERRRHSRAMAETERLEGKIQKGDVEARANDIYNDISLSDQADIVLDAATAVAKQESTDEARFRTFKHDNPFSVMVQRAANSPKTPPGARFALRLIIPFEKAMSNYVKAGFDMTGAGIATGLTRALLNIARGNRQALFGKDRHVIADPATLRQRQKAANRAFGRGITGGAGGLLLGYTLAGFGVIGNPKDDENKKKGRVASLHILGQSFDLSWLGPLALPLAMGAGYYHDQFGGATRAFGKGMTQAPVMRGGKELYNYSRLGESKDIPQAVGTIGGRLTSSFIPGFVKDAAKLSDFGKDRETKGFMPQIQQNVPWWRKELPERKTKGSSVFSSKF